MMPVDLDYRILLWPGDAARETDISADLLETSWRFGELRPNQFGTCMRPAAGLLTLKNPGGAKYRGVQVERAPGDLVTAAGPIRVEIDAMVLPQNFRVRVFRGFVDAVIPEFALNGDHTARGAIYGALGLVAGYHDKVYTRLQGNALSGAVAKLIFDDAGYTGELLLSPGVQEISGARVYRAGLLGGNRQRATTLTALKAIYEAEIGRCYDNRLEQIVGEGRNVRAAILAGVTQAA